MIEGLKLRVTSAELCGHLKRRAGYHLDRAKEKSVELEKLREIANKLQPEMQATELAMMNKSVGSYNTNPREMCAGLEADIRDHNNRALAFSFFADHLFAEDYTLMEADLQRIEILKR